MDPKAESFIMDAAQNDKDLAVRRAAIEALMLQKRGGDLKALEYLLSTVPPKNTAPPVAVAPERAAPPTTPVAIPSQKK
jgi:hypothetical protein